MAINFSPNDIVVVSTSYIQITLSKVGSIVTKGAVQSLGRLKSGPATVIQVGNLQGKSYVTLLPLDTGNSLYNRGRGSTVFFENDTQLNNSLEFSSAFFCDYLGKKVLNNSGVTLPKGSAVYQSGFDTTTGLPEVDLGSAAAAPTAFFLGFLEEELLDGGMGS